MFVCLFQASRGQILISKMHALVSNLHTKKIQLHECSSSKKLELEVPQFNESCLSLCKERLPKTTHSKRKVLSDAASAKCVCQLDADSECVDVLILVITKERW